MKDLYKFDLSVLIEKNRQQQEMMGLVFGR